MTKPKNWTDQDKKRVQGILTQIAAHDGLGWQGIATALGLKSRATPQAWHKRGRVPPECAQALIKLAPPQLTLKPSDISPAARALEQ